MAATWAVTLLLVGYFSVCNGTVCSANRRSLNGTGYRYIYSKVYMYCSNICCGSPSARYCCYLSRTGNLALKGFGGCLGISLLLILLVYLIYDGCKNRPRRRPVYCLPRRPRVTRQPRVTSSGVSRGIEPGYGEKPITHYPMPPSIKANDLPPANGSTNPAHPAGQNSNGGQINTRTLSPGTIHPPPSVLAPAWQAPPPGAPSQSDNPQPGPPTTSPSNEAQDTKPPPVVTAPGASGIHPLPALTPLPPSHKAPTTAAPKEGEEEGESY